ncbi:zinc-dependent alcohol dehydrogenase family protein [Halalkalibacter oceani]|uniref:zinc-dependent alcohol dehydrogenase family protein n=1 Tax=Halalkalibacter oceani TaxID=1653776 RepID=UPI003398270C
MLEANCIICHNFGRPQEVLKIEQKEVVPPQDDEVLVRMLARPINPSDLIPIRGSYAHRNSLPHIPGYEGVGLVEQVGPLAPRHLVGARVLPLRGEGTWQEYVRTKGKWAVPVPDWIDHFTAAQMYINPVTAWVVCTEVLRLGVGDVLAVNAGGSTIGRLFAQLANVLGFRLIAVTRHDRHTEQLLQLGASAVVNTSEQDVVEAMWELTDGRGAHAAIDSVGGAAGNELAYGIRPGGMFLSIGLLSGRQVNWEEIVKQAGVRANLFHLRHWNKDVSAAKWQETFQQLIQLIESRQVRLMEAAQQYDLIEVKKAVAAVETISGGKGKVFLTSG